ncbi:MAG: ATP-dependent helicase [Kiritimatiellaeota bacterium]|nr:ATP-dependent helicase [Kiritimatiellota bacterium]
MTPIPSVIRADREACATLSLDEFQQAAVDAPARENLLVLAGPGSGKTRVLTQRAARLASTKNTRVLALTFSRRAANEIRERLGAANGVDVLTLHALALRLLREHGGRIGLEEGFTVVETKKSRKSKKSSSATSSIFSTSSISLDDFLPLATNLLEKYRSLPLPWDALLIDEAQDLSPDQWRLLETFRARGIPITLVGDPDQSIYGFRGVDVSEFAGFAEKLKPRVARLSRNYRSDAHIVEAASAVIAPGRNALSVAGEPRLPHARKIRVYDAPNAFDEARFIARDIREKLGGIRLESVSRGASGGLGFRDFAVLVRVKHQMNLLEAALARDGIPTQIIGVTGGFPSRPGAGEILEAFIRHAADAVEDNIPARVASLATCHAFATPEARALWPEFAEAARAFPGGGAKDFFDFLATWEAVDAYDAAAERVTLMTLHAAKGLEFSVVYVAGCEDGLLPLEGDADLAEERRLFYVGMTRARDELALTHARQRMVHGRPQPRAPSPFLADIPAKCAETTVGRAAARARQMEFFGL